MQSTDDDVEAPIRLYDWNTRAPTGLYEDLGRLEVFRKSAMPMTPIS